MVPVSAPALEVQRTIASFLDRECARIDALLAELSWLVRSARLEVDRSREYDLAKHGAEWGRGKLGWRVAILSGCAFPSDGFITSADDGVPLLRGINVAPGALRWGEVVFWPHADVAGFRRYSLREGDLVLGLDRPWISGGLRIARVTAADLPALLLQRVACLRTRDDSLDLGYVQAWLQTDEFAATAGTEATGISVPHISPGQVASFRIAVPPRQEQERFGRFEAVRRARVDELAAEAEQLAVGLRAYREALVTEAVTGLLDVTRPSEAQLHESLGEALEGYRPAVLS